MVGGEGEKGEEGRIDAEMCNCGPEGAWRSGELWYANRHHR